MSLQLLFISKAEKPMNDIPPVKVALYEKKNYRCFLQANHLTINRTLRTEESIYVSDLTRHSKRNFLNASCTF